MTNDLTAIYYTAHLERAGIEEAVRETHWQNKGDVPVISVTHRPIDFGTNICVGQVGVSDINAFRQFEMGVRAAQTKYVCNIEADFVYPPEYFHFRPQREDVIYVASPLYVFFCQVRRTRRFFRKPGGSEGAIIVARDYLLSVFEEMFRGCPQWAPEGHPFPFMFSKATCERANLKTPVVTFKTDQNMGRKTPYLRSSELTELPYWGHASDICKRYHLPAHVSPPKHV